MSDPLSGKAQDQAPRMIVGLGNPGERYAKTRHNAGFMVVDALASESGAAAWSMECQAHVCLLAIEGQPVFLVKPLTFMNLSGNAVKLLLAERGLEPRDVLLLLDDLNLPFGRIRIRAGGSAGGHNGLKSVLRMLESEEVPRLRLGIGEENMPADKAEFVLSDFPAGRLPDLAEMIIQARNAVKRILRDGVSKAMVLINA